MLDIVPAELWVIIGGLVSLITTFVIGRKSGKDAGRKEQVERDLKAAISRKEKNNELQGLDDDERNERLDRWVRKSK